MSYRTSRTRGRVLVAGASGRLGREVTAALRRAGWSVRAMTRDLRRLGPALRQVDDVAIADLGDAASLAAACREVDVVFSCAGASMALGGMTDRARFDAVDAAGNLRLLERARAAGVSKFVYVSVFGGRALAHTEYAAAHEQVVEALYRSGVAHAVVRPTGFFSFHEPILRLAARGRGAVIGDGRARTNPIDERDLAELCAAVVADGTGEVPAGGPEVYTRREIVELAFEAAYRAPRVRSVPPELVRAAAAAMRPLNPRLAALLAFGTEVSLLDVVAPAHGARTLPQYFAECAPRLLGRAPDEPADDSPAPSLLDAA